MVGRDLSHTLYGVRKTTVRRAGERILTVQNLKMAPMVKNNSLSIFAGQITGVFGLVGAGRTETFKIVAGVLKRDFFYGGEIFLRDQPVRYRVPAPAVQAGVAYVTEDRKIEGFFETSSIARNIYLGLVAKFPRGRALLSRREQSKSGSDWVKRLKVRAIGDDARVVELSGGNQQKVVIAKSLIQEPDLIIFDEPTRGVDVGAIVEIHELINRARRRGQGGGRHLLLPARDHGAFRPHSGLASGQGGRGILGARSDRGEDHVRGHPLSGRRLGASCSPPPTSSPLPTSSRLIFEIRL